MSSLTLLPEVSSTYYSGDCLKPQDCLIVDPNHTLGPRLCELWRDLGTEYDLEKEAPPAAPAAAGAAAVAPAASEDFVGLAWSSDGLADAAEEEARILEDLLRLGLELGDLEDVFGNTEIVDPTTTRGKQVEDDREEEEEEEEEVEVEVVGVEEGLGGVGSDAGVGTGGAAAAGQAVSYVQDSREEDDDDKDDDLLLDADLQDALLTLPEIDFVEEQEQEGDDEGFSSSWTSTNSTALGLGVQSISSPLTVQSDPPAVTANYDPADTAAGESIIAECPAYREAAATPVDAGGQGQVSSVEDIAVDVSTSSFPGGDQASGMEDAVVADVSASFPAAVECCIETAAFVCEEGVGVGGGSGGGDGGDGGGGSGSGGGGGGGGCGGSGRAVCTNDLLRSDDNGDDNKNRDEGNTIPPSTAAKTDPPPPGVPTRLLDAIDLWESAHGDGTSDEHARSRSGEGRSNSAKPARSGRKTSGGGGGHKKKKNEFGKRRRSSGGGNAPAPDAAMLNKEAGSSKGKVDPLTALKDVRRLSRKPLIVQWLRSDGCASDEEAEAAVTKAVGSLSSIASYWGSGGG